MQQVGRRSRTASSEQSASFMCRPSARHRSPCRRSNKGSPPASPEPQPRRAVVCTRKKHGLPAQRLGCVYEGAQHRFQRQQRHRDADRETLRPRRARPHGQRIAQRPLRRHGRVWKSRRQSGRLRDATNERFVFCVHDGTGHAAVWRREVGELGRRRRPTGHLIDRDSSKQSAASLRSWSVAGRCLPGRSPSWMIFAPCLLPKSRVCCSIWRRRVCVCVCVCVRLSCRVLMSA